MSRRDPARRAAAVRREDSTTSRRGGFPIMRPQRISTSIGIAALAIAAFAIGLAVSTSGPAEAQKTVRWKMASAFGGKLPHLGTSGIRFSENLKIASGGTLELKFFEPGSLVPALECFDAVSKGSVEACWTTPGYHT